MNVNHNIKNPSQSNQIKSNQIKSNRLLFFGHDWVALRYPVVFYAARPIAARDRTSKIIKKRRSWTKNRPQKLKNPALVNQLQY